MLYVGKSEICNFTNYNTLFSRDKDISDILRNLKQDMEIISEWFKVNSLKTNSKKPHIMILGKKIRSKTTLKINSAVIHEINAVVLLGKAIDNNSKFIEHIKNLCSLAYSKLHVLRRIKKYLKILSNAFINSQFNYAPIICMLCMKTDYHKMKKKTHHRALKMSMIVKNHAKSFF